MRYALIALLFLAACGNASKEKSGEGKAGEGTAGENKPAEAKAVEKTPQENLCRLWASPENAAANRALLSFSKDGKFVYYTFDGTAWNESPSTYKLEGDTFTDLGDGQTYKASVTDASLSLDNPAEGKQDFLKWRPAAASDCDADSTAEACSMKGKKVPFNCAP
jgi:hypothetical protein